MQMNSGEENESTVDLKNKGINSIANAISIIPQQSLTGVLAMLEHFNLGVQIEILSEYEVNELGNMLNATHVSFGVPIRYMPRVESEEKLNVGVLKYNSSTNVLYDPQDELIVVNEDMVISFWQNFYKLAEDISTCLSESDLIKVKTSYSSIKHDLKFKSLARKYRETYRNRDLIIVKLGMNLVKDYRAELYQEILDLFETRLSSHNLDSEKVSFLRSKLEYRGNS